LTCSSPLTPAPPIPDNSPSDRSAVYLSTTLYAALPQHTSNTGLLTAASTTYEEPYIFASLVASPDHASKHRACWNVLTCSHSGSPLNFGLPSTPRSRCTTSGPMNSRMFARGSGTPGPTTHSSRTMPLATGCWIRQRGTIEFQQYVSKGTLDVAGEQRATATGFLRSSECRRHRSPRQPSPQHRHVTTAIAPTAGEWSRALSRLCARQQTRRGGGG
jgi:hypothetical protein